MLFLNLEEAPYDVKASHCWSNKQFPPNDWSIFTPKLDQVPKYLTLQYSQKNFYLILHRTFMTQTTMEVTAQI